jgi:predicted Ser/Thr protein kinase
MLHSQKEHLQKGKIIKREDGTIYFKATFTGKPSSFCKRADSYLNNFSTFHRMIKENVNCCKTCTKKYEELKKELIKLRN